MPSPDAPSLGVDEMLGEVMDSLPQLANELREGIAPLRAHRDRIRAALTDAGALHVFPDEPSYLSLSAVDGAYTLAPLFVGDQINTLAVSIRSTLGTGALSIEGHLGAAAFRPHSPGNELLAKCMMMCAELDLLAAPRGDEHLVIVDGSHLTAVCAIFEALAAPGTPAYEYVMDDDVAELAESALATLATSEEVIACPKSDSATALNEFVRGLGVVAPLALPDKVLASLVLEPGEVLDYPDSSPPWGRYDLLSHQITSRDAISVRDRLAAALLPLREVGVRVAHTKPRGGSTALRIETKASVNDFAALDYWQAVADDCAPPYTQEPVAQYLADHIAKGVSDLAQVQVDSARLDLAEGADPELLEFLIRTYRTS